MTEDDYHCSSCHAEGFDGTMYVEEYCCVELHEDEE